MLQQDKVRGIGSVLEFDYVIYCRRRRWWQHRKPGKHNLSVGVMVERNMIVEELAQQLH
jgi:hypothetical protein